MGWCNDRCRGWGCSMCLVSCSRFLVLSADRRMPPWPWRAETARHYMYVAMPQSCACMRIYECTTDRQPRAKDQVEHFHKEVKICFVHALPGWSKIICLLRAPLFLGVFVQRSLSNSSFADILHLALRRTTGCASVIRLWESSVLFVIFRVAWRLE